VCTRYQFEQDLLPPPTPVGEDPASATINYGVNWLPIVCAATTLIVRTLRASPRAQSADRTPEWCDPREEYGTALLTFYTTLAQCE